MLVEFRHRSWFEDENRADVLSFLEELGATNVVVDAPKTEAKNLVPTVVAATSPLAYVRLHGRNAATWNVRGGSASDRFDYLYTREELSEWVEPPPRAGREGGGGLRPLQQQPLEPGAAGIRGRDGRPGRCQCPHAQKCACK